MAGSDLAFAKAGPVRGRLNRFMVHGFDRLVATPPKSSTSSSARASTNSRLIFAPNGLPVHAGDGQSIRSRCGSAQLRRECHRDVRGVLNSRKNVDSILRIWSSRCVSDGVPAISS